MAVISVTSAASAQSDNSCHGIDEGAARLSCYDEQTGYEVTSSPEVTTGIEPAGEQWSYNQDVSVLDGRTDVWLSVLSSNVQPNQIGRPEPAELWVQCIQNTTSLGITFNDYVSENQSVRYRLGEGQPQSVRMRVAAGGEGLGLWSGGQSIPFVRQMLDEERLVIGYQSYGNSRLEFTFDISGLRERIGPLAEACGWQL